MKVEELKEKLAEMEKDEICVDVNLNTLKYAGVSTKGYVFNFEGKELSFEGKELGIFSQEIDVNLPFVKKCSDALRQTVFNEFISKSAKPIRLLLRGTNVSGLLPAKTPHIKSSALVDTIASNVDTAMGVNFNIFNGTKCFDFISKINAEPTKRVGDITHCGVSLVEERKNRLTPYELSVGGYLYRLSCSNGAVTRADTLHRIGGKSVEEVLDGIGSMSRRIFEIVSNEDLAQFVHLDEVSAPNPANLVHRISREHRIPASIENRIMDRMPEIGAEPTMYDLINLITSIANDSEISLRNSRLLQEVGGHLTISAEHRCPTCKVLLN